MAEHASILSQRWTDIIPPLAPEPMSWWLLLSSVVLLLLVVLVVLILWQQRPRQRALRVLRRCRKQLLAMPADTRQIAYALHRALLQGLGLHPAGVFNPTQLTDPHWQHYFRQVQHCVFQAAPPSVDELAKLVQQGAYWLRQYPSHHPTR